MADAQSPQPLGGNDMPRFGGIATFMRLPGHTAPSDLDVAVVGVPFLFLFERAAFRPIERGDGGGGGDDSGNIPPPPTRSPHTQG